MRLIKRYKTGDRVVVLELRKERAGTVVRSYRVGYAIHLDDTDEEVWRSEEQVFDAFNDETVP